MVEFRRHPLPPEWTTHRLVPGVGGVTPPALMQKFDHAREQRRRVLQQRYGSPLLGAALASLVRSYGLNRRPVRGQDAWSIVESWDHATALWLRSIPNSWDAYDPLARAVAECRREAVAAACRDVEQANKARESLGRSTGVVWQLRDAPGRARELMYLATTDEAYAYVALHTWRPEAHAQAAFAGLDPVPDPGPAPDDDDDEGGGKGVNLTSDDLEAIMDDMEALPPLPEGF